MSLVLTARPTEDFMPMPPGEARIWVAHTPNGVECLMLVAGLGVEVGQDASELGAVLRELPQAPVEPEILELVQRCARLSVQLAAAERERDARGEMLDTLRRGLGEPNMMWSEAIATALELARPRP